MSNFKTIINPETGEPQKIGSAKLVSPLSEKILENSNGTKFRMCTVEVITDKGVARQVGAQVYEGNYAHQDANFAVGNSYLVTISKGDERGPLVQLSHLSQAGRLAADDFDFSMEAETAPATEAGDVA